MSFPGLALVALLGLVLYYLFERWAARRGRRKHHPQG